jgi:hypothetical protein
MPAFLMDSIIEELAAAVVMTDANDQESIDTVRRCLNKLREAVQAGGEPEELVALAEACLALEMRRGNRR